MSVASPWPAPAIERPVRDREPRVWRPFPLAMADLVCVEEAPGDLRPRIHRYFTVTLIRSPAVVRVERSRSLLAGPDRLLLVPPLQLYGMRLAGALAQPAVTLLLGPSQVRGLEVPARASVVVDPALGAQLVLLVAQLGRPVRSLECLTAVRSLLECLLWRATPVPLPRSGRATPLDPVRDSLGTRLSEPVPTAVLAGMIGLTESHLVRAYHLEYGLPPHAYHLRLRLAQVCELLAGGLSVSEAAYECGFADQSHLSRKFKQVYQLTPAAWGRAVAETPPERPMLPRSGCRESRVRVPAGLRA
jgi:AraC-like DNA-binding protein